MRLNVLDEKNRSVRVFLAYFSLALISLLVRTWGGLGTNPPYLNSDEVQVILAARHIELDKPATWQGRMDAAVEMMMMVPVRTTQVLFGDTVEGSRMAHVILGSLTIVALFGFARWLIGDFAGWIAGFLLAVNHVHVYFSRNLTAAATQSTLAVALVLAFGLAGMHRPACWVLAGMALGWGVRTYPMAWPLLPLLIASFWIWRRELTRPKLLVMLAVVFGFTALTCWDWATWMVHKYPYSLKHLTQQRVASQGMQAAGAQAWKALVHIWVGREPPNGNYGASMPALDPVTGGLFFAGIGYALWRWRTSPGRFFLLWFPVLMLPVMLSKTGPHHYRLMPAILCACVVSAWVLCDAAHALVRPVIARSCVLIVVAVVAYFNLHYVFMKYPSETGGTTTSQILAVARRVCRSGSISQSERAVWLNPQAPPYFRQLFQIQCPDLLKRIESGRDS